MKTRMNLFLGTLLLLGGAFFMLSALGVIPSELSRVLISWQALILAIGLILFFFKQVWNAVFVVIVGLYFFIPHCFTTYGVEMPISKASFLDIFVASLLLVCGLWLILDFKKLFCKVQALVNIKTDKHGSAKISSIFGETKHTIIEKPFKNAQVATIFGETTVNLTKTILPDGDSYLDIGTIFGTTVVVVPQTWEVKSIVHSIFASTNDKRHCLPSESGGRLILRGGTIFGELIIKSAAESGYEPITPKEDNEQSEETIDSVSVKHNNQVYIIALDELQYIQSDGDYVSICTSQGRFLKEQTMKYFQQTLPTDRFLRIHRSYIVNLSEIKSVDYRGKEVYYVVLKDGTSLRASVAGYQLLRERLEI